MKFIYVNQEWTFRDTIRNLKALKTQYKEFLALFSYLSLKNKVEFIKNFRDQIYSLKFEEWKKDRIWEYLNGDEEFETLILFVK